MPRDPYRQVYMETPSDISFEGSQNIIQARESMELDLKGFWEQVTFHIQSHHAFDQEVRTSSEDWTRILVDCYFLVYWLYCRWDLRASMVVLISIPPFIGHWFSPLHAFGFILKSTEYSGDGNCIRIAGRWFYCRRWKYWAIYAARLFEKGCGNQQRPSKIFIAVLGCTATLIPAFYLWHFCPRQGSYSLSSMAVLLTIIKLLFVALRSYLLFKPWLLKKHESVEGNVFMRAFKKYVNDPYAQYVLAWAFRHPVTCYFRYCIDFMSSLMIVPWIGFSLFPRVINLCFCWTSMPQDPVYQRNESYNVWIEQDLLSQPNIVSVSTNVGKGNPRVYYNEFQQNYSPTYAQLS